MTGGFGESVGNGLKVSRHPVPPWKLGTCPSQDRRD